MSLQSERAVAGPSRHIGGSCDSVGRLRPLKRKSSGDGDGEVDVEAALSRKVKSKSPPTSPSKQTAVGLYQPEVQGQVPLNLSVASEVTDNGDASDADADAELGVQLFPSEPPGVAGAFWWDNGDASDAELGAKLFPNEPPKAAIGMWNRFVTNAKLCLDVYNQKNQATLFISANFVYKHSRVNGFSYVGEQDFRDYYHLNFHAQDKSGHSQLFFGEIEAHTHPTVENVTCCCAVSPSDAGGRGIPTVEEALKHEYPDWETVGMDYKRCYACIPRFKHPKGTCYVAGHFADTLQYYSF
ncbi:unnamed protein product [Miscanthus lutarioriparius]|uniref:DUF3615 domain-containing protein n=1 Tax=Miscanthus lutarioriparius TaxID=422564 RepID=A0A811PKW5_9POAL|nr:unnamed protein product [Miscanthus lutarioriparius]